MNKKLGIFFMVLGVVLVAASVVYMFRLEQEEQSVAQNNQDVLQEMAQQLENLGADDSQIADPYSKDIASIMYDGYEYIGCLSIPALELELPVMSTMDDHRLKLAPCLFQGSVNTNNMIIGAHNYKKHFASLSQLKAEDEVVFTAMDGSVYFYYVSGIETLLPTEMEKLVNTDYDLSLFTCVYTGQKRTVVRCYLNEEHKNTNTVIQQ